MKLLFVLEHFYPYVGGAEKLFFELTRTLVEKGHSVTVVTTRHHRSLPSREMLHGIQVFRINCFNRYLFTLFSIPQIFKLARQCDLIHTTTYNAALPARLVGKLWNKPVMITFHEVWDKLWRTLPFIPSWQRWLFRRFEKLIIKLAFYRYIAVSKYTQSCLMEAGVPAERIITIYNGLDYTDFPTKASVHPDNFTYTYFGRLGISKGLDILLPVARQFWAKYPTSKLQLIIPRQPQSIFGQVQKMIRQFGLEGHIIMHHDLSRQDLQDTLLRSSCVVIPSYSEGFCFAAAESVALGIPIVSSQRGALREVVSGKYLSAEPLSVNALYDALQKAAKAEWLETPIKRFPLEKTVEQHLKMYSDLIGK